MGTTGMARLARDRASGRFYTPEPLTESTVALVGSEAHHVMHVARKRVGERIFVFDGRGTEAIAEIGDFGRGRVQLVVTEVRTTEDDTLPLVLATAVPKGERFRWLVEKATELGVSRLIPLRTARSVVVPGTGKLQKMRQTVIAACKQCGRTRLMPIDPPASWSELLARRIDGHTLLLADPEGCAIGTAWRSGEQTLPLLGIVGPEGGLTSEEYEQAVAAGAQPVHLGSNVLRIETAAVALAAACRALQ